MGTVRAVFQTVGGIPIKMKTVKNLSLTLVEVIKDTTFALDGI